jgi:hypothetical protein
MIGGSSDDADADGDAVIEEDDREVRLGNGRADVPFVEVVSADIVADDVIDADDVFVEINDIACVNDPHAAADAVTALLKEGAALIKAELDATGEPDLRALDDMVLTEVAAPVAMVDAVMLFRKVAGSLARDDPVAELVGDWACNVAVKALEEEALPENIADDDGTSDSIDSIDLRAVPTADVDAERDSKLDLVPDADIEGL